MYYNSIEYDIGQKLGQIQDLYNKIGTMTYSNSSNNFDNIYSSGAINYLDSSGTKTNIISIVNNNTYNINSLLTNLSTSNALISTLQSKTTNLYYNSLTNTTSISGLFNFGIINSTSINNTSFVDLTNGQTIAGIKRFSANMRLDSALLVSNGTVTISNASLGYISSLTSSAQSQLSSLGTRVTAVETKTTPITYTSATVTTLISGVLQYNGTLNGWSTTNFSNAINYAKDLTSNAQTQISNLGTRITGVETNVTTLSSQINNFSGVSLSNNNIFTGATNQFSNTLRLDGALNLNANALIIPQTILQKIQYLSTVSSDIQTQTTTNATNITTANSNITTLTTKLTDVSFASSITTIVNTLASSIFTFSSSINGATKSVFDNLMLYCNSLSENTQTAINTLKSNVTTLTNTLNGQIEGNITNLIYAKLPIGSIIMSPLSYLQASSGFAEYLLCNGQNVSRTTYQNLFSRYGTTFGAGDGSTTFTLPNYQGLFFRGMGSQTINGTTYTGVAVNNAQQDSIQNHQHGAQNGSYLGTQTSASPSGGYLSSYGLQRPNQYNFDTTGTIAVSGIVNSDETRVVNVGIYYYVKT
jgi:microcystin-dependent protein